MNKDDRKKYLEELMQPRIPLRVLQEIRQEITEIPMTIQRTRCFNEREISDYRSDVLEVIDKHIEESEVNNG